MFMYYILHKELSGSFRGLMLALESSEEDSFLKRKIILSLRAIVTFVKPEVYPGLLYANGKHGHGIQNSSEIIINS